mmetsp:Transcript_8816/g.12530  ORF Transcript_8816/g.12530 Transcript_8816/m.12530 type:complete len:398 (-) Transcript_8816:303-1496(-)
MSIEMVTALLDCVENLGIESEVIGASTILTEKLNILCKFLPEDRQRNQSVYDAVVFDVFHNIDADGSLALEFAIRLVDSMSSPLLHVGAIENWEHLLKELSVGFFCLLPFVGNCDNGEDKCSYKLEVLLFLACESHRQLLERNKKIAEEKLLDIDKNIHENLAKNPKISARVQTFLCNILPCYCSNNISKCDNTENSKQSILSKDDVDAALDLFSPTLTDEQKLKVFIYNEKLGLHYFHRKKLMLERFLLTASDFIIRETLYDKKDKNIRETFYDKKDKKGNTVAVGKYENYKAKGERLKSERASKIADIIKKTMHEIEIQSFKSTDVLDPKFCEDKLFNELVMPSTYPIDSQYDRVMREGREVFDRGGRIYDNELLFMPRWKSKKCVEGNSVDKKE